MMMMTWSKAAFLESSTTQCFCTNCNQLNIEMENFCSHKSMQNMGTA